MVGGRRRFPAVHLAQGGFNKLSGGATGSLLPVPL